MSNSFNISFSDKDTQEKVHPVYLLGSYPANYYCHNSMAVQLNLD